MKRIALIITSSEMIRSYLETKVFENFPKDWDLFLYTPTDLISKTELPLCFSKFQEFESITQSRLIFLFFDVLRWRNKEKSISFKSRNDRLHPHLRFFLKRYRETGIVSVQLDKGQSSLTDVNAPLQKNYFFAKRCMAIGKSFLQILARRSILAIFSRDIFFALLEVAINPRRIRHPRLYQQLKSDKPDLILYPTSGFETLSMELVFIGQKLNSKSMFLFDNWDNLSSKTVMYALPDFIGTWGQQSSDHAVQISGFPKSRIFEIGAARFTNYMEKNKSVKFSLPERYLLFSGSFLNFDEYKALRIIDNFLMRLENHQDLYVIYRPHPEGVHKNSFQTQNFQRVLMDPQFSELLAKGLLKASGNLGRFSLDYYPYLISNAEFVVGGLTSLLIEATLFQKLYITLEHDEPHNLSNPAKLRGNYTHFKEISRLPNLISCKDLQDLPRILFDQLNGKGMVKPGDCLKELDFFVRSDVAEYSNRLKRSIEDVINSGKENR